MFLLWIGACVVMFFISRSFEEKDFQKRKKEADDFKRDFLTMADHMMQKEQLMNDIRELKRERSSRYHDTHPY